MTSCRRAGTLGAASLAGLVAVLLASVAPASAAPFAPGTPVAGFGDQPALAQIAGAAIDASGASVILGVGDTSGSRRAVAAFGPATAPPSVARGFGPSSGAFDPALAANAAGDVALTFTVGHVAYLATCREGRCGSTVRVGTSALKPQSAVAVEPATGRTIVMWRGRTSRGVNRLMWRITTDGRLGATHTLGEFGDTPQLATDASGRTVAVWLADSRSGTRGVRTAARRVGEFTAPTSVTVAPAGALRLVAGDAGSWVAGWLTAPNGIAPEQPAVRVARARVVAPAGGAHPALTPHASHRLACETTRDGRSGCTSGFPGRDGSRSERRL